MRERPGGLTRLVAALAASAVTAALACGRARAARSGADAGAAGRRAISRAPVSATRHRRADGLPRHRHACSRRSWCCSRCSACGRSRRIAPGAARPGPRYRADPDGALAFLARTLPPVGLVVGVYIFWIGADLPGGTFQGATHPRRDVAAGAHGRPRRRAAGQQRLAAHRAGRRPAGLLGDRRPGLRSMPAAFLAYPERLRPSR